MAIIGIIAIVAFGLMAIAAAIAMFFQRSIFKAAIFLSASFAFSSVILIVIGEYLVAILQLLILVGGIATYLIVAVASEQNRHDNGINVPMLFIVAAASSIIIGYLLYPGTIGINTSGTGIYSELNASMANYQSLMFFIALLAFGAALPSIAIILKNLKR